MIPTLPRTPRSSPSRPSALVSATLVGLLLVAGCSDGGDPEALEGEAAVTEDAPQPSESLATPPGGPAEVSTDRRSARPGRPKLVFEKRQHDFGAVYDIETVKTSFVFKNTGEDKLVISEVQASCGCTALELDQKIFEPGESHEIKVEYTPKGFGRQRKTIDVMSNSDTEPVVRLEIAATITRFVKLDPHNVQFGKVQVGQQHEVLVDLVSLDPELEITGVKSYNPKLLVSVLPGSVSPNQEVHSVVKLTLKEDAPWGNFRTNIELYVNGKLPEGELVDHVVKSSVTAEIYGKIQAEPAFYAIGAIGVGEEIDGVITLTHVDGAPFEVLKTSTTSMSFEGLQVTPEKFDGGVRIRIHGPSGTYRGNLRGAVVVETDVPGEVPMSFQVMGIVRPLTEKDYEIRRRKEQQDRLKKQQELQQKLGSTGRPTGR